MAARAKMVGLAPLPLCPFSLPLFTGVREMSILGRTRGTILCQPAPSPAVLGRLDLCYELRVPPCALTHMLLYRT
jgi:hypothetical protein